MKNLYSIFLFFVIITIFSQQTPTVTKLEQINTYNGGDIRKTILDRDMNLVSIGFANGPFAVNNTNIVTSGTDDLYLLKTDKTTGENIWVKTLNAGANGVIRPSNISVDNEDNYYVTATFSGEIVINNITYTNNPLQGINYILIKFDSDGNALWGKTYNSIYASSMVNTLDEVIIKDENVYLLINSNSLIRLNKNTGFLISEHSYTNYRINSIKTDGENLYAACGNSYVNNNQLGDLTLASGANFILKLNDNLDVLSIVQIKSSQNTTQNLTFKNLLLTENGVFALFYKGNNLQFILENSSGTLIQENKMSGTTGNSNYSILKLNKELSSSSWFNTNTIASSPNYDWGLFHNKNGGISIYFPYGGGSVNYGNVSHSFSQSGILNLNQDGSLSNSTVFDDSFSQYKNIDYAFDNNDEYFIKTANFNRGIEQFSTIYKKSTPNYFISTNKLQLSNFPGYFNMTDFYKITPNGDRFFSLRASSQSKYTNYFGNSLEIPTQNTTIISKLSENAQNNWNTLLVGNNIILSNNFGSTMDVDSFNQTIVTQDCLPSSTNCKFIDSDNIVNNLPHSRLNLLKIDEFGKMIWKKEFSYATNFSTAISKISPFYDSLGNIYLVGVVNGSFTYGSTTIASSIGDNILFMKIDSSGNYLYHKIYNYTRYSNAFIKFDNQNNPYLFLNVYDYYSNLQFDNITLDQSNSYIKLIMLKFDSNGNVIDGKNLSPNVTNDNFHHLILDIQKHDNDFIIYSWTNSQTNLLGENITNPYNSDNDILNYSLITKISSSGNPIWSQPLFFSNGTIINNLNRNFIDINQQGEIYILDAWNGIGSYKGNEINNYSSNKLSLLKIDGTGNFIFFKSLGSIGDGFNLSISNENKVTLSTITSEKNLDEKLINNLGGQNFVILKLDEEVLSTQENKKNTFEVYPNPTSDFININTKEKIYNVEIYDATGKKVLAELNTNSKIDVRKLLKGVYYIRINTDTKSLTSKFIKN